MSFRRQLLQPPFLRLSQSISHPTLPRPASTLPTINGRCFRPQTTVRSEPSNSGAGKASILTAISIASIKSIATSIPQCRRATSLWALPSQPTMGAPPSIIPARANSTRVTPKRLISCAGGPMASKEHLTTPPSSLMILTPETAMATESKTRGCCPITPTPTTNNNINFLSRLWPITCSTVPNAIASPGWRWAQGKMARTSRSITATMTHCCG